MSSNLIERLVRLISRNEIMISGQLQEGLPLDDESLPVATLQVEINCDFDQTVHDSCAGGRVIHAAILADSGGGMKLGDSRVARFRLCPRMRFYSRGEECRTELQSTLRDSAATSCIRLKPEARRLAAA
jgi:hypothetical protein